MEGTIIKKNGFNKFLLLWMGEFISTIGSGMTSFGLGIYVYQLTGKATIMTLVMLLAYMPGILLAAPAGVLADRYDRRLMMIIGDSLSGVGILIIFIAMVKGSVSLVPICIGVTISSCFSALMDPAYKATVTDLLTEDEYAKASGMVQIAGSSRYLIAPIVAGFIMSMYGINLLLLIDICTFFVTVITITIVRRDIKVKPVDKPKGMMKEIAEGIRYLKSKKGVLLLAMVASVITFFMGFIQILSTPMLLAFTNEKTLGIIESVIACGMLVSSVLIGIANIKSNYLKMLSLGLVINGVSMFLYGIRPGIVYIGVTGFVFFLSLPIANTALECLVRRNLDNGVQGRIWGLISIISQTGFIVSYAISGVLADCVFTPLLMKGGALAGTLGMVYGVGEGRGIGLMISLSGIIIVIMAVCLLGIKSIRKLNGAIN